MFLIKNCIQYLLGVSRIVILIFAAHMKSANSDYDIRGDPRNANIANFAASSREYREYLRILANTREYFAHFLNKKKRKKSTKWTLFTIFVEIFSRKSTFFRENQHFRDIRNYSREFTNITGIRARYSWSPIPYYSRRSTNSEIFATPLVSRR